MKTTLHQIALVSLYLFGAGDLLAQSAATASLAGTLLDPTSAAISAASVVLTETTTGVNRSTSTGPDGEFLIPLLPPGRYSTRAEKSGFRAIETGEIALEVGERRRVELRMQIGEARESITVEASNVTSTTNDISLVVNQRRVSELPLNGKNFLKLEFLTPGIGAGTTNPTFTGARDTTNTFQIDGVGATDQRGSRGLAVSGGAALFSDAGPNLVSTEAIREFRVISSSADATFGRGSGGQISVITKSGTNDAHGSVYYYGRNDALDARNFFNTGPFFDDRGRSVVPPFKQHQYGASFGGRIRKDRDFFFGNFEGFRQKLLQSSASTVVPNAALIGLMPGDLGLFYRTFYIDRGIIPTSGNPAGEFRPIYTTEVERQQFLTAGFNPVFFDENPSNGEAGGVRISSASTRNVDQDSYLLRTDHRLTDRLSFSARYAHSGSKQLTNLIAIPFNNTFVPLQGHHGVGQLNYAIDSKQFLEFRFGLMRSEYSEGNASGVDEKLLAIGISDKGLAIRPAGTLFSQFNVNPRRNFFDYQTVPEASLLHSWTRGRLTLRSGFQWRKSYLNTFSAGSATPAYDFSGYIGPNGLLGERPGQAQAISSAFNVTLFGIGGGVTTPLRGYRQAEQEYFSQADFRLNRQFTVNVGLRYSYNAVLSEANGILSNLYAVDPAGNLAVDKSQFEYGRFSNRVEVISRSGSFYKPDRNNFQPRLGFAWDIGGAGRSVLRAGYGIYTDRLIQIMVLSAPNSTPYSLTGSVASAPFRLTGLPTLSSTVVPGLFGIDPSIRNPFTHRYNITLEQRLDRFTTVSVSYVGAAGRNLTWNADYNGGGAVPQDRRPDSRLGRTTITTGNAKSDYNSLQVLAQRRWAAGLDFTAAYTYASSRDNITGDAFGSPPALINLGGSPASGFQGGGPGGWANRPLSANWGYSDFNLRQNLALSHVWDLPFGKGRQFLPDVGNAVNRIIGGFSLSGIAIVRSGQPVDVQYSGDLADVGAFSVRPVLVSGSLSGLYSKSPSVRTEFLIPASDARQRLQNINVTDPASWIDRNALRGPGVFTYDVSLIKRIPIGERVILSFEANAFNIFNRTNFGNPTNNLASAFFGQVSSIAPGTTPRQLQFGLKLTF